MWGMPERRGQKAQRAEAPKSDQDGKTGYDTLAARRGLYPKSIYQRMARALSKIQTWFSATVWLFSILSFPSLHLFRNYFFMILVREKITK
jgi:hypothetical protein